MPPPRCDVGANEFISHYFHDCVYNYRDFFGFALGLASIATWMFAQFPQIYSNIKNRSAEALSAWFLAEWLMGDTCNLIGCLLTGDQLVTQTYTAMYFICADICLVMQYIYYGTLQRRRQRALRNLRSRAIHNPSLEEGQPFSCPSDDGRIPVISQLRQTPKPRVLACMALFVVGHQFWSGGQVGMASEGLVTGRRLLSDSAAALARSPPAHWTKWVGQSIGWISSFFYLGSRCAQIYKTWARRSSEGLSIAMFACAITANILYGGGILMRTYAWADIVTSAPWLLGSLGTVFLDLVIFSQFAHYSRSDKQQREQAPLLEDGVPE